MKVCEAVVSTFEKKPRPCKDTEKKPHTMLRASRRLLVVTQDQMHERLSQFFASNNRGSVEVVDSSGGCGASFDLRINCPSFVGKTLPNQHKMVVACLKVCFD